MSISDRITEGLTGRKGEAAPKPEMGGEHEEGGAQFQIHDHGDGTFHSITKDGQRTEHPHVGHSEEAKLRAPTNNHGESDNFRCRII